jgi:hypothetical protein
MKLTEHPLFATYHNMKARCNNPKLDNYKYYGAKGIKVCEEWLGKKGLITFIQDMGERPTGFQLDRIDVNGDYCKENCRWVNKYVQMGNTTKNNSVPGVGWHKQRQKYRARIKIKGKDKSLGLFSSWEEAVEARNKAYENLCL